MNKEEITALASEYAEEMHYGDNYFESENKRFLTWLTRRYCLVEKDKAREVYAERTFRHDPDRGLASIVVEHVLNRLFPEIAKEVEE